MNSARPVLAAVLALISACAIDSPSDDGTTTSAAPDRSPGAPMPSPAAELREVAAESLEPGEPPAGIADIVSITPGAISRGEQVWVLETVDVDGDDWHLVAIDRLMDEFNLPYGWIPAIADGSPTLVQTDIACPAPPLPVGAVTELGRYGGLACFGSANIEIVGFTPLGCGAGGSPRSGTPEWLNGTWTAVGIGNREPLPPDFEVEHAVLARAEPGPVVPAGCGTPGWYRFTGHFDDPAAATCRTQLSESPVVVLDPRLSGLICRSQFVITSAEALPREP